MSEGPSLRPAGPGGARENVAAASRGAFAAWVDESPEGRVFGQVLVRGDGRAGYSLGQEEDADVAEQ